MRALFTVLLLLHLSSSIAQVFNTDINAMAYGMANAAVANIDEWSIFNNVAGIAHTEHFTMLSSLYHRFNIRQLSTLHLGLVYPKRNRSFGLTLQGFGDFVFNQQQIGFAYGQKLGGTSVGLKFNFHRTNARYISSKNEILTELGVISKIFPSLEIGFHLANIGLFRRQSANTTNIPIILKTGFSFHQNNQFRFNFEIEKKQYSIFKLKMGIWYLVFKKLLLNTGVQINPLKNFIGLGYLLKKLTIHLALSHHYTLGFSQLISLSWCPDEQ